MEWERSLERFREKWELANDEFFQARLGRLGWRRSMLLREATKTVTFGRGSHKLASVLKPPERTLNRLITQRHNRRRQRERAAA